MHTTDGTFIGTVGWFGHPESAASAHYLVGLDGRVVQFVDEQDTAQHAGHEPVAGLAAIGDDSPNLTTIGIEFDDGHDPHDVVRPDAQYRAGAELLAGVSARWGISLDRDHVIAHRQINPAKTCPGNLDIDRLIAMAGDVAMAPEPSSPPRLVVLLPARNAEDDLPGWFESVERFADSVVALDDGSTDRTHQMLAEHPLVEVLLRNPRRESYVGWDDSANRNRLLLATAAVAPDWVLSVDADERIGADDAAALREFLATDALAGFAYGMRCLRMIDDDEHFDRDGLWVYRLFAYAPQLRFPTTRLHFVPVPTAIPASCRLDTTLRIQHRASLTTERREARFAKYRQADPDVDYQPGYDHLLDGPGRVRRLEPRPADLAVLFSGSEIGTSVEHDWSIIAATERRAAPVPDELDPEAPVLTAIVISRDDEDRIERAVASVTAQESPEPFEVIVVTSGNDRTADIVRRRFPAVRVVELDHAALPGEARNAGLRVARGAYVSFPGSHVELPPGSLASRIRAHDEGWSMVTGTTRNGTYTRAGWAAYFLDHSTVLPGRPSEPLSGPPAHCSYDRRALLRVGGFPEDLRAGEDTWVNHALFRAGESAYRAADLALIHHNRSRTVPQLARRHFERGRALTVFLRGNPPGAEGDGRARAALVGYRRRRRARIDENVARWGADVSQEYRRARGLVRLGILAAWLGARAELRRPTPRAEVLRTSGPLSARVEPLQQPLRVRPVRPPPFAGVRPIFVHLPKTAGSTLLQIIEREVAPDPVLRLYGQNQRLLRELAARSEAERRDVRAVSGHMGFGIDTMLPGPSVYLTLLRDPVDRIVSHYFYLQSRPDGPDHAAALQGVTSLEEYVESSALSPLFHNGQCRLLGSDVAAPVVPADRETLRRATAVLARPDVLVGFQDRFEESLALFRRSLGWGYPAYRNENVATTRPALGDLPPSTVELIRDRNALDVELYEHARIRFGADLAAAGDLSDELDLLRRAGRWSEFSPG